MVTLGSKRKECQRRTEEGTRRRERGGTTRWEMKEIDGRKAAEKREERRLEGGGKGRVGRGNEGRSWFSAEGAHSQR